MNIEQMQDELRRKGIRIDDNDPLFLMLTINEILLEDMSKHQNNTVSVLVESLEIQTGEMLAAANIIREEFSATKIQMDEYIETTTQNTIENVKTDIVKAAKAAANSSIQEAIVSKAQEAVSIINSSTNAMKQETENTMQRIGEASRQITWNLGKSLTAIAAASCTGALVMFLTLHYSGLIATQNTTISDNEKRQLQNGKSLDVVWSNLTTKEQKHISDLAKDISIK